MPNVRASSGMIGTTRLPSSGCFNSSVSTRTKAMVLETSRPAEPSRDSFRYPSEGATILLAGTVRLGMYPPSRTVPASKIVAPSLGYLKESLEGSAGREVSSTMAMVRVLTLLFKHPELGTRVVTIIPDEARTFGMESLFRQFGIYASQGQLYKPHDAEIFLYYKESKDGQILEEGITEAGSMSSFTAAGT